jgi:hypothetical protein
MESGWSESYNHLMDDMNKLLVGGDGAIQVVVTINWTLNRRTRLHPSSKLHLGRGFFCRGRTRI